ncbi:MAG: hypothetical protein KGS61_11185 [Verrucomicrobia bacterium]|nr:hypothetical protein [Verrucomicrobiota bacterium]
MPGLKRVSLMCLSALLLAARAAGTDSAVVKKIFAHPPREFSTGPLWVWNDRLTDQEIIDTLRDLAGQQVKQVFVHPRPGLMTPYLSNEWFRLWKVALREARRLDMSVWIYDENSYPSGFAGGWVPEVMPEARGRGLSLREVTTPPRRTAGLLGVFRIDGGTCQPVTSPSRQGGPLPSGRYVVASVVRAANAPWNGDRCYVDLMYPGVTEKFLQLTLDAYQRAVGGEFGHRVPGVFTDEPNIRPAGGLPWTDDLPRQFQRRWGYNLLDCLPSLAWPVGDWRRVRHNYFTLLNELFIERWAKPYHDYCERHHLEWTGHYWDHEWPDCGAVPDNMAMYAWQQRPAIDCLMNQYQEHTHAQFGNRRMVRELASVANQLGKPRTLCETYGAGGWDLRFEDMKRIGDWLEVLGVNTLDQHLSYVTIRGARKRDHPQSFSYHEPWWEAYHLSAEYFARLSAALSQGEQINRVLVIEPTTTAWMYQGDAARLKEIGDAFFQLLMALDAAQVEYDLGDEDLIARHGSLGRELAKLEDGHSMREFQIGKRGYQQIILAPFTENLNQRTRELIRESRLRVEIPGAWPDRVDGALTQTDPSSRQTPYAAGAALMRANLPRWIADTVARLRETNGFGIDRLRGDPGILFHQRRQLDDGELLFLVNTSLQVHSSGVVSSPLAGVERWDLETGKVEPYPFAKLDGRLSAKFDLPPAGSLLLFLSATALEPGERAGTVSVVAADDQPQARRLAPNVLTLDYVDISAGGETRSNVYVYQANQFAFQKNGLARNPWDSAVQFRDEIIRKRFPPDSGFTATYRFDIEHSVPPNLSIVVERPELYQLECNGTAILERGSGTRSDGGADGARKRLQSQWQGERAAAHRAALHSSWWLDRSFGRIDLAGVARIGQNVLTLRARPFTVNHELESAYLLGDFDLETADRGFVVVPARPLELGRWNEQGHPFYSGGVVYSEHFKVDDATGKFRVRLTDWYGSVAKVIVNGRGAGYVGWPPWQCDVSQAIRPGSNAVDVVVIGTLKNTLGPHHGNPALGTAWPGMFQHAPDPGPPPGSEYSTVGYGLFAPFVLERIESSLRPAQRASVTQEH